MLFSEIENWEYAWMFSSVGALIRTIWWLSRDPWVVRHRQPESASLPPIQKLPYANAPTNILIEGFFLFPCSIDNWLLYFSMVGFGSIYSSVSNHPHSSLLQQSPQMTVTVRNLLDPKSQEFSDTLWRREPYLHPLFGLQAQYNVVALSKSQLLYQNSCPSVIVFVIVLIIIIIIIILLLFPSLSSSDHQHDGALPVLTNQLLFLTSSSSSSYCYFHHYLLQIISTMVLYQFLPSPSPGLRLQQRFHLQQHISL